MDCNFCTLIVWSIWDVKGAWNFIMKKGELTTQQIVMIIILVISFSVLLFLFFRLNPGELTKKDICHNSVVLKTKSSSLTGASLDCSTNYVCISGGGECENIIEDYKIEVDVNNKDEILNAIAEEMVDCHWMFGEGEIDYVSGTLNVGNTACSICFIVSFDEEIKQKYPSLFTFQSFYSSYLVNNKKSNSQTYSQYLYGTNDITRIKKMFDEGMSLDPVVAGNIIETDKNYAILTGIKEGIGFKFIFSVSTKSSSVPTFFIKQENIPKTTCDEFLTKA